MTASATPENYTTLTDVTRRREMATAKKTQTNRLNSVAGPPPTGSHAESIQMQSALIDRTA